MQNKVIMILVDGMRPDAVLACGHAFVDELMQNSTYTMQGTTVMPSVTLPVHMSLFHSVVPERHGVTTNLFTPQVRPVPGLCEQLSLAAKKAAMFYTWDELRDITRPNSLTYSLLINGHKNRDTDHQVTEAASLYILAEQPDFVYLYLGETDDIGHRYGWMSEMYLQTIQKAFNCIERIYRQWSEEYTIIVLADHGGHDRGHGTSMAEDMTVPLFFCGKAFEKNRQITSASVLDIAPTIAKLLEVPPAEEWEGKAL